MKSLIVIAAVIALAGCEETQSSPDMSLQDRKPSADNTKLNDRDRALPTLTPIDQGENAVDRGITQQVRQDVVKNDGLSMTAKNVKIITIDGVVTLRGPVKSEEERQLVGSLAQTAAGVKRVDNQLEIAPE